MAARKTKIICTIGPECYEVDKLIKMLDAGMNVASLNFAGSDHKVNTYFNSPVIAVEV